MSHTTPRRPTRLRRVNLGRSGNLEQVLRLMPTLVSPLERSRRSEVTSVITRAFRGRNEVLHHAQLVKAPLVDEFGGLVWQAARASLDLAPEVVDEPSLSVRGTTHFDRDEQTRVQ